MRVLTPLFSSTLLALSLASPANAQGGPPPGYIWHQNPGNQHYYALTADKSWTDVRAEVILTASLVTSKPGEGHATLCQVLT